MKRIITALIAIIMGGFMMATPVFATKCVPTAVLGNTRCDKSEIGNEEYYEAENGKYNCSCDNEHGSSVVGILQLIVDIMMVLVGIVGVIGITIVGIQYLTAGGSEEKTRKAKRRMFEIVLGIVLFSLMYALLKWLGAPAN